MVGGCMENLEKPQNCQSWWLSTCTGMGACPGQYGTCTCTSNGEDLEFVLLQDMQESVSVSASHMQASLIPQLPWSGT